MRGLPVFENCHDELILQAFQEGFRDGSNIAIYATHVEARDAANLAKKRSRKRKNQPTATEQMDLLLEKPKEETPVSDPEKPKKRGRKRKEEREQWLKEQAEIEAAKPIFEKKLDQMADYSYEEIEAEIPLNPIWGTKKNTDSYKGAVDCESQYILVALFSSAHVHDGKMSIPLLKALAKRHPYLNIKYVLADAGYDFKSVYKQIRMMGARPLIDYNRKNEAEIEGKDKYFRPVCKEGYSYVYDSFDKKYETLKFTRPKECETCPFKESGCQNVFKIKVESDIRKYTVPARGSEI